MNPEVYGDLPSTVHGAQRVLIRDFSPALWALLFLFQLPRPVPPLTGLWFPLGVEPSAGSFFLDSSSSLRFPKSIVGWLQGGHFPEWQGHCTRAGREELSGEPWSLHALPLIFFSSFSKTY